MSSFCLNLVAFSPKYQEPMSYYCRTWTPMPMKWHSMLSRNMNSSITSLIQKSPNSIEALLFVPFLFRFKSVMVALALDYHLDLPKIEHTFARVYPQSDNDHKGGAIEGRTGGPHWLPIIILNTVLQQQKKFRVSLLKTNFSFTYSLEFVAISNSAHINSNPEFSPIWLDRVFLLT